MKKEYMTPQMEAVNVNMSSQILAGSPLQSLSGPFSYGGGSSGTARAPEFDWDEWE